MRSSHHPPSRPFTAPPSPRRQRRSLIRRSSRRAAAARGRPPLRSLNCSSACGRRAGRGLPEGPVLAEAAEQGVAHPSSITVAASSFGMPGTGADGLHPVVVGQAGVPHAQDLQQRPTGCRRGPSARRSGCRPRREQDVPAVAADQDVAGLAAGQQVVDRIRRAGCCSRPRRSGGRYRPRCRRTRSRSRGSSTRRSSRHLVEPDRGDGRGIELADRRCRRSPTWPSRAVDSSRLARCRHCDYR